MLIARSFTCYPWSLFLASFLLCQSDVQEQFHFTCGTMNGTLWVPPSIALQGREMVAGGGLSTLGPWAGRERRKLQASRRPPSTGPRRHRRSHDLGRRASSTSGRGAVLGIASGLAEPQCAASVGRPRPAASRGRRPPQRRASDPPCAAAPVGPLRGGALGIVRER
jgi:hypothetical protein